MFNMIPQLDQIWKFACWLCTKTCSTVYEELLSTLELPSLSKCRALHKLCLLYKIIHNLCYFLLDVISFRESRVLKRSITLSQPFSGTNAYFYSFTTTSISKWNSLPDDVILKPTLQSFKTRHYYITLI